MSSAALILAWLIVPLVYTCGCTQSSGAGCERRETVNSLASPATVVRQAKARKSLIYFTADNWAAVYLNGVKLADNDGTWEKVKKVRANIAEGDVISFDVTDYGGWYGFVATIKWGSQVISTGRDSGWLAQKKYRARKNAWRISSFKKVCTWKAAVVRPDADMIFPGKAKSKLLRKRGAQYIWASNAGEADMIFVRYRLGGETICGGESGGSPGGPSDIWYNADDYAEVYVNGKRVSKNGVVDKTIKKSVRLSEGDVVGLKVSDFGGWWGAITAITGGVTAATGVDDSWRATQEFDIGGNMWASPSYTGVCEWDIAEVRPREGGNWSADFPYSVTNAAYVWAPNVGEGNTIYLRYRVGGENC